MAIDTFSTAMLNRVVRQIDVDPEAWLLTSFFPQSVEEDKETIFFDVETERPRITPFVSPLREGRIVESEGFIAKSFKPAYAKDKRRFDPDRPVTRVIGEPLTGTLSPEQRTERLLAQDMANQNRMLTRREEVMASELLRTGKVTVSGEGFPTQVVDFGRASALTVAALTGGARWSETSTADPVGDIETWAQLIYDNGGGVATNVIMAPDAWRAARKVQSVKDLFETRRGSASEGELGPLAARRVRNPGTLGEFNIWVYQDQYIDETGATQLMMPSGTVILANGAQLEGVRHYGMIKDYEAMHTAQRAFYKSWTIPDPSHRLLLMQSAPLVVSYRPNASLGAEVLNGGA